MKKTLKEIVTVYNDFLPKDTFQRVEDSLFESKKWEINKAEGREKYYWGNMDFYNDPLFNKEIFSIIQHKTNKNFKLLGIRANAQSTLQDGAPHIDSIQPNTYTLMLYANAKWDIQWGGYTIFFDRFVDENGKSVKNTDRYMTIFPFPNGAVLFPTNMYHYGTAPSKDFPAMRFTVTWQLEEIF